MAGVVLRGFVHLCPRRVVVVTSPPAVLCRPSQWTSLPGRTLHLCPRLCAGHNKWSKVKHIKGPKDAARANMFAKLGMLIRLAVKEGGSSNPETNVALAQIVEQCRGKNMPKANIEAAIKGGEKLKTGSQVTFEARGPGGCQILIEILTDNKVRSHNNVRWALNKHGGTMCDGARHNFDRKGVVLAHGDSVSSERALELAIEAGAEDVQETEDEEEKPMLQFVCELTEMKSVRAALEELEVRTVSASLGFISHTPAVLPQEQLEDAFLLLQALNDLPDVVRVWDNIQAQG